MRFGGAMPCGSGRNDEFYASRYRGQRADGRRHREDPDDPFRYRLRARRLCPRRGLGAAGSERAEGGCVSGRADRWDRRGQAHRHATAARACHRRARGGRDLEIVDGGVDILATVRTADRTGVEMEALTAASIAALSVVDMVKGMDKGTEITHVRIEKKTGGKSGDWHRETC